MHLVLIHVIRVERLEGTEAHVQRYLGKLHSLCLDPLDQLFRKVESSCRCSNGPLRLLPRIHCLICREIRGLAC